VVTSISRGGIAVVFFLLIFIVLSPIGYSGGAAAEKVATNMQVVKKVSKDVIDELLSNMNLSRIDGLVLLDKAKGVGDIDFVFDNMLLKEMKDRGLRVAVSSNKKGQAKARYKFSYQILKLSLEYPRITRKYWLGTKRVKRSAVGYVFAQMEDTETGDVVWVGESQKSYDDEIDYALLDRVENRDYKFTMPERNELKWSKLAEPVVVTGIVAGLVYLFFSNQSNE